LADSSPGANGRPGVPRTSVTSADRFSFDRVVTMSRAPYRLGKSPSGIGDQVTRAARAQISGLAGPSKVAIATSPSTSIAPSAYGRLNFA
jgi:hypothetical protein